MDRFGLLGTVRLSFGYDHQGRVHEIHDGEGRLFLEIDRPGAAPVLTAGSWRTQLALGPQGWLENVKGALGETAITLIPEQDIGWPDHVGIIGLGVGHRDDAPFALEAYVGAPRSLGRRPGCRRPRRG